MVREDLTHAQSCVSDPETHVYACLRSSPSNFDLKKNFSPSFCSFFNQNMVAEDLRNVKNCVSGPETHVYVCRKSSNTVF